MASRKPSRINSFFTKPRHWYHVSSTLSKKREYLIPWDNSKGFNRTSNEPDVKRTCVAPSIAHCLAAIPYCPGDEYMVYRTLRKMKATRPTDVFDADITLEGWIKTPAMFILIGKLSLPLISKKSGMDIINEAASDGSCPQSGKVLKWWKRRRLTRYLKCT